MVCGWSGTNQWKLPVWPKAGIVLGMGSTNKRGSYIVTSSLIGWAYAQNDPWKGLFGKSLSDVWIITDCVVCCSFYQQIEGETKWPTFCSQHFSSKITFWQKIFIVTQILLKYVASGLMYIMRVLVQIMVWHRIGDKPPISVAHTLSTNLWSIIRLLHRCAYCTCTWYLLPSIHWYMLDMWLKTNLPITLECVTSYSMKCQGSPIFNSRHIPRRQNGK